MPDVPTVNGATGRYDATAPFKGNYGRNAFLNAAARRENTPFNIQVSDLDPSNRPQVVNFIGFSKELMEQYDENRNGVLELEEYEKMPKFAGDKAKAKVAFEAADLNQDGKIDLEEETLVQMFADAPVTEDNLKFLSTIVEREGQAKALQGKFQALLERVQRLKKTAQESNQTQKAQEMADKEKAILEEIRLVKQERLFSDEQLEAMTKLKEQMERIKADSKQDGIQTADERDSAWKYLYLAPAQARQYLTAMKRALNLPDRIQAFNAGRQYAPAR